MILLRIKILLTFISLSAKLVTFRIRIYLIEDSREFSVVVRVFFNREISTEGEIIPEKISIRKVQFANVG